MAAVPPIPDDQEEEFLSSAYALELAKKPFSNQKNA